MVFMAKKRTKKQKVEAKHHFTLSWNQTNNVALDKHVKREISNLDRHEKIKLSRANNAKYTAKDYNLALIKNDLVKTLIISSLILSLEVVLYFVL